MTKHPRLFKRAGKWTFRAKVPDDLRARIGKREIWKSFGAVSYAEALKLARIESVKVDTLFAEAKASAGTPIADLSEAEIQHLSRAYLYQLELCAQPMPLMEQERLERRESAGEEAASIAQSIDDASLQLVATRVARDAKIAVAAGTSAFLRLTEGVQRALVEHYTREQDRAEFAPERVHDSLFTGLSHHAAPPQSPLSLARAVELYKADPERSHVSARTRVAYDFRFALLMDILGSQTPVSKITRADVREVREILLKLPANATKRFPQTPARKVAELAERQGITPMKAKSAGHYIESFSALFRWLVKEDLAERNPAVGLRGPALPAETDRRPFTVVELNKLFVAPAFSPAYDRGWMYWIPRLALYTGARFAELLGLQAHDVIEMEGAKLLRIEANAIRGLKTRTSRRLVPIHPALIAIGILEHAASVPASGMLFPDAAGPKDIITAQNKKIGAAIRRILPDPDVVFHSFRHTFKDAAQRADLSRDVIAALGGWDLPGGRVAMDSYGRAKLAAKLAAEMAKIEFEGVRL